ncbi:peroxiredoxin [Nitrobacteraceae bacterium AZCC 2161]
MPEIEPGLPAPELDADQMAAITVEVATASSRALRAGSMAPNFRLRDHGGRQLSLQELSATGPTIVHFYRGSWCTYCQDGLTDLAAAHADIRAAGGQVVAIAPPPSPEFVAGAQADAARLPFTTLIDDGMKVAVAYGIAYSLPAELRPIYLERGYVPPRNARAGEWPVPIPATYLVSSNGTIVLGAVDVDYRNRLHSDQLVTALSGIRRRGGA